MTNNVGNTTSIEPSDDESTLRRSVNYTLILPIDFQNERMYLAKKARGTGKGKWLGFGGKIDGDETAEDGAIREMREETGLVLSPKQIKKTGLVLFTFLVDPFVKAEMHIFTMKKSDFDESQLQLNDEFIGNGQWFNRSELPTNEMWTDFKLWNPNCFEQNRFRANFNYVPKEQLISYSMQVVTDADDDLLTWADLKDVIQFSPEVNHLAKANLAQDSS